jgi:hypothetical protein
MGGRLVCIDGNKSGLLKLIRKGKEEGRELDLRGVDIYSLVTPLCTLTH